MTLSDACLSSRYYRYKKHVRKTNPRVKKSQSYCLKGKFFAELAASCAKTDKAWDKGGCRLMFGRDWHMPSSFVFFGVFAGGGLLSSGFFQGNFYYRPCFLSGGLKLSLKLDNVMPFLGVGWSGYFQERKRSVKDNHADSSIENKLDSSSVSRFHRKRIRNFCSFSGGFDIQVHPLYWLGFAVQIDCAHRSESAFERKKTQDGSFEMRKRIITQLLLTVKYGVPTES